MTQLRWGESVPADAAAARERLIDAAESCLDQYGLAKTTLEDVARAGNVSRATVYRYFRNRDELILAVILRELDRSYEQSLDDFAGSVGTPEQAASAIVEAALYLLDTIRGNPKLQLFLGQFGTSAISGASQAFFEAVADDLRPYLEPAQARGAIRAELDVAEASEWILRTILSLLTVDGPASRTREDERRFLTTYLVPALVP